MTDLVSLLSIIDFNDDFGRWMFLSIGAISIFGISIPLVTFFVSRRKERQAFYRAETLRRIAEVPGEGARAALELLREEERLKSIRRVEGMKVGGLIQIGFGIALLFFLHSLGGPGSPYLCGLIFVFIGLALLTYALFMAPSPDRGN